MKIFKIQKLNLFIIICMFTFLTCNSILDSFSHADKDEILLSVSSLNSVKTQIPFDYYYLNICPPEDPTEAQDNLGEIIKGQKTFYTDYRIIINQNEYCNVFCRKKMSKKSYNQFKWLISKGYTINFYLDLLPAGYATSKDLDTDDPKLEVQYNGGIPIGYIKSANKTLNKEKNQSLDDEIYIYNHYRMYVHLHNNNNKSQIVGFEIEPFSIKQNNNNSLLCKDNFSPDLLLSKEKQLLLDNEDIIFTYDVIFKESDIVFASRFDHYSHINSEIHWLGIINSTLLILILTLLTIIVVVRSIKRDIDIYNTKITTEEVIDEYGWKSVANDVFRKPVNYELFSSILGTGSQLLIMLIYSLLFASFKLLKPEARGSVLSLMILVFVFLGLVSGYVSGRAYKMFQGRHWFRMAFKTAFFFPGFCYVFVMLINFLYKLEGSNVGMDFKQITSISILWIGCSTPLIVFGTFVGIKQRTLELPGRTNPVPADVPPKPWYFHLKYSLFIAGIPPFAAIFIELIYIMSSIWRHEIYFLAAFIMIAIFILIIISAEIGFLYTYINLCRQDHKWWWKCFFISASPSIYMFIYSVYYFFALHMTRFSTILIYFGLTFIMIFTTILICGTVGVITTFIFLIKMYQRLRIN